MSDTRLESLLPDDQGEAQPAAAEPVAAEPSGDPTNAAPPAAEQATQVIPADYVPRAAVQDERKKRQELERRVQEYERMIASQREQQPQPDWYAEPDRAAQVMQQQVQYQLTQTKVAMSEEWVRAQHPDYDEHQQVFIEAANANPHLWQQLYAHPMPAQFAYQQAKKLKVMQEIGDDPEAYRKRIIDEFLASQGNPPVPPAQQPPALQPPKRSPLPTSLAETRNAQPRDDKRRWQGPASLDQLLGD